MLNYLYYKLYQAALKSSVKDIPNIAAGASFGALIAANTLVINGFLSKTISLPFLFTNPKQAAWLTGILIAIIILYFRKDKHWKQSLKNTPKKAMRIEEGVMLLLQYMLLYLFC